MEYTHPKNLGPALKINIVLGRGSIQEASLVLNNECGLKWSFSGDLDIQEEVHNWLLSYAEKTPDKLPPLEYSSATLFTERVWRKVAEVPFGAIKSYGDIATSIGHPSSYRAVGSACRKNVLMLFVPCHRIVKSNNTVSGCTAEAIRRCLLEFEKA